VTVGFSERAGRERIYAFRTKEEEKPYGKEKGADKEKIQEKKKIQIKKKSSQRNQRRQSLSVRSLNSPDRAPHSIEWPRAMTHVHTYGLLSPFSKASKKESYGPPNVQTINALKTDYGSHPELIVQIAIPR